MRRLILAVSFLLASCSTNLLSPTELATEPGTATPVETHDQEPQETLPPIQEAATEISPINTEKTVPFTSYPLSELSQDGPWLVYYDEFSPKMVAMNQDGTGRTELDVPQPLPSGADIAGAPAKSFIAYISGDDDYSNPDLDMVIVELPSGKIYDRIPLIEPDWHEKDLPAGVENKDLYLDDVMQSIRTTGSFEWSPEGRYLAYVGATAGPSGDVYVYDTINKGSIRLTTGAGQAALLSWSPGGEWIAHLAVRTFCCGAGWNVEALWVVNPTGTEVERVTSGGNMFFIQKWLGDQSFIMTTWTAAFGPQNLSTLDIREKDDTMFFEAQLRQHAFDTAGSVVALYLEENGAEGYGVLPGIYVQPRYGGTPIQVHAGGEPLSIDYSDEADRFVAGLPDETIIFDRQGVVEKHLSAGGTALISPDGNWIAIYDDGDMALRGAQIYSFSENKRISLTKIPVGNLFWGPDSKGVFVTLESLELIYIPIDTGELFLVDEGISLAGGSKAWVGE